MTPAATLRILLATVREQARAEKAYVGNFWSELASTLLFVITSLLFLELLFRRVGEVAGFTKNDFFFMMLVGQFTFYSVAGFLANPMALMIENVRNGSFDLVLLRPVATRLYLYARGIRPIILALISLPNILLFCIVIDWSQLSLTLPAALIGMLIWICGFIIFNTLVFTLALPVFRQGDSADMLNAWYGLMGMTEMPYPQVPKLMRAASLVVLPSLLMTAGASAVMLGKMPALSVLVPALIAALVSIVVYNGLWRYALRNYSSASS